MDIFASPIHSSTGSKMPGHRYGDGTTLCETVAGG